jgi:hypothetical protein
MLDRTIDLISPFCIQQTYEGVIDEYYDIKTNQIEVDRSVIYPAQKDEKGLPQRIPIVLKSQDDFIFAELRSMSHSAIGIFAKKKLTDI